MVLRKADSEHTGEDIYTIGPGLGDTPSTAGGQSLGEGLPCLAYCQLPNPDGWMGEQRKGL